MYIAMINAAMIKPGGSFLLKVKKGCNFIHIQCNISENTFREVTYKVYDDMYFKILSKKL